jgi:hypothetical protein
MLHIHNGDSTADTAKQSSLAGQHFAWRESLITGPTPSGLTDDEWRKTRSEHLSKAYGVEVEECEQSLLHQEETLASFAQHEEVVLWFEHDLFCQVHLIYLLKWFSQRELGNTKLSLICVGDFPGKENFRGLGELNVEQLTSLFPARQPVTDGQLALATSAWEAYCSSDPNDIQRVLQADTSPLPFLGAALQAHLRRFPSTKNGLGQIENRALKLIDEGLSSFTELFPRFGDAEPVYGLGDAQFWLELRRMSRATQPLLEINRTRDDAEENGAQDQLVLTPELVTTSRLEMTAVGQSVLKGEADFVALNGIDLWLGGVQLQGRDNLWRWNEQSGTVVLSATES